MRNGTVGAEYDYGAEYRGVKLFDYVAERMGGEEGRAITVRNGWEVRRGARLRCGTVW